MRCVYDAFIARNKPEDELGTRLFERPSRRVRITQSGAQLVDYARRILAQAGEARAELDAIAGLTRGGLVVGATQAAGRTLDLVALFGEYHRRFPDVRLTAVSGPPAARCSRDVRVLARDRA